MVAVPSLTGALHGQVPSKGSGVTKEWVVAACHSRASGALQKPKKKSLVVGLANAYTLKDDGDTDDDGKYWNGQRRFAHVRAQSGPKSTPHNPDQVPLPLPNTPPA